MSKRTAMCLLSYLKKTQQTYCIYEEVVYTADELLEVTSGHEVDYDKAVEFITG